MTIGISVAMLAAVASLPAGTVNPGNSTVTAELVGIRVIDEAFPADEFEFSPFQGDAGTQLHVMLTSHGKQFVELLHRESKISSLTGGEKTDLLQKRAGKPSQSFGLGDSPIGAFPRFSKDRHRVVVEINAPQTPAAGDSYVALKGQLVATLARGKKRVVRKNVPLKPGPLEIEGYQIAITAAAEKKDFSGETRFTVDLRYKDKAGGALESLKFVDPAGEEIKVHGRFWMSAGGVTTVSYPLERPVAAATLEFTFWQELETATIPLDIKQHLGMGGRSAARVTRARFSAADNLPTSFLRRDTSGSNATVL